MRLAGTGHRPDKLGGWKKGNELELWVRAQIRSMLTLVKPDEVMSGMALGFDTWLAQESLGLGLPMHAAVPFDTQDLLWAYEDQIIFGELIERCASVEIVSPGPFAKWKFQKRNEHMVDWLQAGDTLLSCWDKSDGGTANCLRYARPRATLGLNEARFPPHPSPIHIINIDPASFNA